MFEHQEIPLKVKKKLYNKGKRRKARSMKDLLCNEVLIPLTKAEQEEVKKPKYTATEYVEHLLTLNLSEYGQNVAMNEMYND